MSADSLEAAVPRAAIGWSGGSAVPEPRPVSEPDFQEQLAALLDRTEALSAGAVDTFEIAAGLEAEGINDAAAVAMYGKPDVFALAEELYRRVPRRASVVEAAPNPWRSRAVHHLLRGVLLGLPGLCYVAASRSLAAPGAVAAIVLSLLLSWGASEALSYLGYVRLGRGDKTGAARVLLGGLGVALAVVLPATVFAGWAFGAGPVGVAFAVGQAGYLLAATVVLVSGAERWLLAALVPSVAGSGYYLVAGAAAPLPPTVWAAGATTALATLGVAVALTARRGPAGRGVSRRDLLAAVPHAAFGLLAGGLLTFTTVAALIGPAGGRGPGLAGAVVTLPLSLSMGVAELLLFRYRRHTYTLLLGSVRLARFAGRARLALAGVVVGYLAVLALIADALAWVGHVTGGFTVTPPLFWTAVALGGALFVALALRSCGVTGPVLGACAATLAAEAALWWGGPALGRPVDIETVQLVACAVLFGVLLAYAAVVLGRATRHR
jgi:hypothetical protein